MSRLVEQLLERLPQGRNLRSFYLYLKDDSVESTFTFALGDSHRVVVGEVPPAAFGIFIDAHDLRDLVQGFGDVRAMLLDERLRIEGDLGAGMALVSVLAELK